MSRVLGLEKRKQEMKLNKELAESRKLESLLATQRHVVLTLKAGTSVFREAHIGYTRQGGGEARKRARVEATGQGMGNRGRHRWRDDGVLSWGHSREKKVLSKGLSDRIDRAWVLTGMRDARESHQDQFAWVPDWEKYVDSSTVP